MPLTAIPHKHIGPHTWHDICEVVAWSLTCLASGSMPPQRHDNTPCRLSDKAGTWFRKPRSKGSESIAQRAALVEIRADWKFYSEVFAFPYHNEVLGMCWKCRCAPDQVTGLHACMHAMMKFMKNKQKHLAKKKDIQVREVGSNAPWRSQPLSHWNVLQRIIDNGRPINPLVLVPWVAVAICRIDWSHCSDKGVGAEFVGNALTHLQAKFPGATIADRVRSLSDRMLAYYKANRVEDKLDCLLLNML